MAGGEVIFGKDVKVGLRVGRYNMDNYSAFTVSDSKVTAHWDEDLKDGDGDWSSDAKTASYQGIEIYNDRAKKFTWGVGYQHLNSDAFKDSSISNPKADGDIRRFNFGDDDINIWNIGLGYKFTKKLELTGAYARSDADVESKEKQSYAFQLNYAGAKATKPNSWGAFLAYRHLGQSSTIHSTYRENGAMCGGEKGWEIGASYTFAKNILGKAQYFRGEQITSGKDRDGIWTELSFIF